MAHQSLTGTDTLMAFTYQNGADVTVKGTNDTVDFANSTGNTVIDHGTGTKFDMLWTVHVNIYDFQHDPTGRITLIEGYGPFTQPVLAPDGHGGTLLTLYGGAISADFIGDRNLTMASINLAHGGH